MQDLNAPANHWNIGLYHRAADSRSFGRVYRHRIPMVAGILARKPCPNITIVYESGGQDPIPVTCLVCRLSLYLAQIPTIMEMSYSFAQCYNGYVDIGFLGFAQVICMAT